MAKIVAIEAGLGISFDTGKGWVKPKINLLIELEPGEDYKPALTRAFEILEDEVSHRIEELVKDK